MYNCRLPFSPYILINWRSPRNSTADGSCLGISAGFLLPFLDHMVFAPGPLMLLRLGGLSLLVGYVLASIAGA